MRSVLESTCRTISIVSTPPFGITVTEKNGDRQEFPPSGKRIQAVRGCGNSSLCPFFSERAILTTGC
jgi:hypothetical protein